jgi:hypothetical protein
LFIERARLSYQAVGIDGIRGDSEHSGCTGSDAVITPEPLLMI